MTVESEAGYIRQNRDEAEVQMCDALDRLTERLTSIRHSLPIDFAIRHNEDLAAIEQEITTIRVAGVKLAGT